MESNHPKSLSEFAVAGINYRKTDAALRGQFAISNEQYQELLTHAASFGISEFFILSTCNRTEIYGFARDVNQLIDLICSGTKASRDAFIDAAYIKSGKVAVEHLYQVAAGLDSQILGDYEIVGQIKIAAKMAKESGYIGTTMERMLNAVLQTSKTIKNQTALSGGTVSVSFAAVQYLRQQIKNMAGKKILLLGIGKIGRNTCKNVVDYLQTRSVTLINRSPEKACALAAELGVQSAPLENLEAEVAAADIILLATNAAEPVILKKHLVNQSSKLIIDLSIPYNVEDAARSLPNVQVVNVDELAKMKDETLAKRQNEVPKAKAFIEKSITEFMSWFEMRKNVTVLTAVKSKLKEIQLSTYIMPATRVHKNTANPDEQIQRVLNGLAHKMRQHNQKGCHYIEAINEFMATGTN